MYNLRKKCMDINSKSTNKRGEYCIVKSIGDGSNGPHREVVAVGMLADSMPIRSREAFVSLEHKHCVPVGHSKHGWRGVCYGWLFKHLVPTSVHIVFSKKGTKDGTRGQRWVVRCKPVPT